ncbi:MAG: ABC transporter substrate-binding protein [Caldilineaceae bacterium]|nr:ABC transporter substrate-binding protein [Caldilineaceae bacterium]
MNNALRKLSLNLIPCLLALVIVTGCIAPIQPAASEAAPTSGAEPATPAETACEEGFRYFTHELLATDPVCIPDQPERFTYLIYPSYIYALGVKPIAAWGLERDAENYPLIADWINEGIIDHGMPPNLETLVELKPDLMLYDMRRVADIVGELQQIAPLVTFDVNKALTWQDRHRFNAAVFNLTALAEEQIALYEQRATELRTAIEASHGDISGVTVSLVRLDTEGIIDVLGQWYTGAAVIKEIGFALPAIVDLSLPEMQERHGNIYVAEISEELVGEVDGDVLIVFGPGGGGQSASDVEEQTLTFVRQSPLWQTLRAVQTDAIHFKGDYWLQPSILTAHLVIDELAEIFAVELTTPNPFLTE